MTTYVRTCSRQIDAGGPVFVVAEIGIHHNKEPLTVIHL